MACCGKTKKTKVNQKASPVRRPAPSVAPAPPTAQLVARMTGKPLSIREPMVSRKPPGGWTIDTTVNGIPTTVNGSSAARAVGEYQTRTGILDADTAWFEANLQWLNRAPVKYHLVSVADLMAIGQRDRLMSASPTPGPGTVGPAGPVGSPAPAPPPPATSRDDHPPEEWGSIGWRWLGLVLAADRYDVSGYLSEFATVTRLLDPRQNPSLGCDECYREASRQLDDLRRRPPYTVGEARNRLVDFHNAVNRRLGKRVLTFDEAAMANHWT